MTPLGRTVPALLAVSALAYAGSIAPASAPDVDDPTVLTGVAHPVGRMQRCAEDALGRLTLRQRAGQLVVVGSATPPTASDAAAVRSTRAGGVIMMPNSTASRRSVRAGVDAFRPAAAVRGVRPLVSVDQEGGAVRRLRGPGFDAIPSALRQGTLPDPTLRASARHWGTQLRRAGVDLDLAPVADVVPHRLGRANAPIGAFDREYGHTPRRVAAKARAFHRGLRDGGVATAAKHFPGLGRVRGNTDLQAGVTDRVTTRHDRYLRPFAALVDARVPVVMMSSARYARIDRRIAAFSPRIMRGMLRRDLGFTGVVMSDDLAAAAFRGTPPRQRLVRFLRAGGTVGLAVQGGQAPAMVDAVVHRARAHPAFRRLVSAQAERVLRLKARRGLVRCG